MTLLAGGICEDGVALVADSRWIEVGKQGGRLVERRKLAYVAEQPALFGTTGGWAGGAHWTPSDSLEWSAGELRKSLVLTRSSAPPDAMPPLSLASELVGGDVLVGGWESGPRLGLLKPARDIWVDPGAFVVAGSIYDRLPPPRPADCIEDFLPGLLEWARDAIRWAESQTPEDSIAAVGFPLTIGWLSAAGFQGLEVAA